MKFRTRFLVMSAIIAALVLCSAVVTFASDNEKGVGSLYITSEDPVEKGRAWVEASPDKTNKAKGSIKLYDEKGVIIFEGEATQIKGRGESSWKGEKKPYQIKLSEKTDLLSTGDEANKSKTWILLANYYDHSNMRNMLAFDLAAAIGMKNPIEYKMVNLYYDGEYRGLYMLCEKVMIGSGRLEINDLEAENEEANPDVDLTDLDVKVGKTANGATYHYCVGMKNPENYSGGYLLEIDYAERAAEEISYFTTSRGYNLVVKSPECCSMEEMDFIASKYQAFEDALYEGGSFDRLVNTDAKEEGEAAEAKLSDYIDLETAAQCYIINELSKNNDGFISSSFISLDKDDGVLKLGPVWDYDSTFGLAMNYDKVRTGNPKDLYTGTYGIGEQLLKNAEFRNIVKDMYINKVYPLINNVFLGPASYDNDTALRSIDYYKNVLAQSTSADAEVWNYSNFDESCEVIRSFVAERNKWLYSEISRWNEDGTKSFDDVAPAAWYYDIVEEAYRTGLMKGVSAARFNPNEVMTRAQVAQVLYNIGDKKTDGFAAIFSDIDNSHWAYKAVNWAVGKGIVTGYSNETFRPERSISRQELVTMLYRSAGSPLVDINTIYAFEDGGEVKDYSLSAMQWAINEGLLAGYEDNTIRPADGASRAEVAAIMLRYCKCE